MRSPASISPCHFSHWPSKQTVTFFGVVQPVKLSVFCVSKAFHCSGLCSVIVSTCSVNGGEHALGLGTCLSQRSKRLHVVAVFGGLQGGTSALPLSLPPCNIVNLTVVLMHIHGHHRRHCDNCVSSVLVFSYTARRYHRVSITSTLPLSLQSCSLRNLIVVLVIVAPIAVFFVTYHGASIVASTAPSITVVLVIVASVAAIVSASRQHRLCRCSPGASSISTSPLSL